MDCEKGNNYRSVILERLKQKQLIWGQFEPVFNSYSELLDQVTRLTANNVRLRFGLGSERSDENKVSELEERLAELYRKKEQNDQRLIETNNRLVEMEKELNAQLILKSETLKQNKLLGTELEEKTALIKTLTDGNVHLRDEYFALQACYNSLDEKCRKIEEERNELIERLKDMKEKQIIFFNEQNDREEQRRRSRVQSEIEAAVNSIPPSVSPNNFECGTSNEVNSAEVIGDSIPIKCASKFDGGDGEVNDVIWFSNGLYFATGGSDRKVRVFEEVNARYEKRGILTGCNGSVTRLDFNEDFQLVLASSADYAVRIWGFVDQRLKYSLTGHGDKVSTAKFSRRGTRAISGSHDRTIKIWDLYAGKCIKTFFPGSTTLDLTSSERYNWLIISGHFDKNIRLWDTRSEDPASIIQMTGKVTSLNMTSDQRFLLCSMRDETLSLLDIRNNQTVHIYSAEQYRSSSDYGRSVVSPGMQYCAAGSADGQIFIWNLFSTKLEKILSKGGHMHPVLALSWHPKGHMLLSADRSKTVCLWTA